MSLLFWMYTRSPGLPPRKHHLVYHNVSLRIDAGSWATFVCKAFAQWKKSPGPHSLVGLTAQEAWAPISGSTTASRSRNASEKWWPVGVLGSAVQDVCESAGREMNARGRGLDQLTFINVLYALILHESSFFAPLPLLPPQISASSLLPGFITTPDCLNKLPDKPTDANRKQWCYNKCHRENVNCIIIMKVMSPSQRAQGSAQFMCCY